MIRPMLEKRPIWREIVRGLAFAIGFTLLCVAAAAIATFASGCGGAEFQTLALGADAGDGEAGAYEQSASIDAAGGELADVGSLDSGGYQDAGDAAAAADAAADAAAVVMLDAGADVEAPHDAAPEASPSAPDAGDGAPGLCCRIACGTGTIRSGFTCSGACTVGGSCSFQTACGLVIACP